MGSTAAQVLQPLLNVSDARPDCVDCFALYARPFPTVCGLLRPERRLAALRRLHFMAADIAHISLPTDVRFLPVACSMPAQAPRTCALQLPDSYRVATTACQGNANLFLIAGGSDRHNLRRCIEFSTAGRAHEKRPLFRLGLVAMKRDPRTDTTCPRCKGWPWVCEDHPPLAAWDEGCEIAGCGCAGVACVCNTMAQMPPGFGSSQNATINETPRRDWIEPANARADGLA